MIPRAIEPYLRKLSRQYPAITITGPRQSGKTTLARLVFSEKPYVSMENLDTLEFAEKDTRGFLDQYKNGAVFDEAQRCPALFSYLQQLLDEGSRRCRFVLTGSQQLGLRSRITQSLAGRAANCTLLPFSYNEWFGKSKKKGPSLESVLFSGLYPPVHDKGLDCSVWYNNYIQNYIEKDVRQIINIQDLRSFQLFLKMCAARCGQLLNLSGLASDCGISVNTAKGWISVLEASYIIFLLQPHYRNFGKRLIKTPKIYFYDTGLLANLLSVSDENSLRNHALRGQIFESFAISEIKKSIYNAGAMDTLYYWRDRAGLEVDVVKENGERLQAAEIKSGQTIGQDFFSALGTWQELAGTIAGPLSLIYGGEEKQRRKNTAVIPWRKAGTVFSVS